MSSPTADLPSDLPGLAAEDIERRQRLLRQWRRHSALIGLLRKLLPGLCGVILVAIAGWSAVNVLYARNDGPKVKSSQIRMLNPYLQGRTEAGKPYLVRAASAVRDNNDTAKMTLERPVLTLDSGGPEWTKVQADHGVYREDNGLLDLHGHVILDDYKGNHMVTEHAFVDSKKNNVDGETHISGHGPLGAIEASSYSLHNGGAYVHLEGRVKTRIEHGASLAPPATPAATRAPVH